MRIMTPKEYLNKIEEDFKRRGTKIDCWVVYRTDDYDIPVGQPLKIYQKFESLRRDFENIVDRTNKRFGIRIGWWVFDD